MRKSWPIDSVTVSDPTFPASALAVWWRGAGWLVVCAGLAAPWAAWAQAPAPQGGIFTCVDAKGRRLTSDRPIPECLDREQRELNPSGSTRRVVGPTLTAQELAAQEAQQRKAREEANRVFEEKRRDRALLARYPNQAAHDRVRAESLAQIDNLISSSQAQLGVLMGERKKLDTELEFYRGNPDKAPPVLKRQHDANVANVATQQRFVADQMDEKKRVNARFDEELARLKVLWSGGS